MIAISLLTANAVAFALILRSGDARDRLAVMLFILGIIATIVLQPIRLGATFPIGVALVDLSLFLSLWALSERSERWWLSAAAGFQLISVGTFMIPIIASGDYLVWTGVQIRLLAWCLVSIALIFGAWETWAARRFAKEATNAQSHLRRGRSAVAPR